MDSTDRDCALNRAQPHWHAPTLFRPTTADAANAAWMLLITGTLTAAALSYALCGSISGDSPSHSSLGLLLALLRASVAIALIAAAGALDVWIIWRKLSLKPIQTPGLLSRHALVGWIFLPAIVLLEREDSLWLLPLSAFAAAAIAISLRHLFPLAETAPPDAHLPGELPTLYGLPQDNARPAPTLFIAACAQFSLLLACAGALLLAGILLMAAVATLVWSFTPATTNPRKRSLAGMLALALFVTVLAQLPWSAHRLSALALRNAALHTPHTAAAKTNLNSYVGIVLWPPPKKHTDLYAPLPSTAESHSATLAKPFIIPFDGPYWYFQAPHEGPGAQAHIAHGKPTDPAINPRSANENALLMEAHQTLSKPIDPRCCRAIDVTLANADTLSGRINLGLRLSDSTQPKQPPILLGVQQIPSSAAISANRSPVQETLRFPIPSSHTLRRFDKITLFFLRENQTRAAKVEILSFALIPR